MDNIECALSDDGKTIEIKRDKAILLSYISLTGKCFYVLLDNDGSGKYLVKEYSDEQMKGLEYNLYVLK